MNEDKDCGFEAMWCELRVTHANDSEPSKTDGVIMYLLDFENKADFIQAAKLRLMNECGIEEPVLRFHQHDSVFNVTQYVSDDDVSEHLWALMSMELDDIDVVYAYQEAYGIGCESDPKALLNTIQEEGLLFGCFSTLSEMAKEYLARFEDNESILELVQPYLDLNGVGEAIVRRNGITACQEHYFIDPETKI